MAIYWIQVSEDFDPVSVDLIDAEVAGVRKLYANKHVNRYNKYHYNKEV